MSPDDEDRALQRYVAGLPVDEATLTAAVTGRAVESTIVTEAMLAALESAEATARLRAAERAARMAVLAPRIARELTRAVTADVDLRVRAAAADALAGHGLEVPGQVPEATDVLGTSPTWAGLRLLFRRVQMRGVTTMLVPLDRDDAPAQGFAVRGEDGLWSIALSGLPASFAGARVTLRMIDDAGQVTVQATAGEPVSDDGSVTIIISRAAGSLDEIEHHMAGEIEIVADDA